MYHLGQPAAGLRDMVLSSLGPDRLSARYDWLYAARPEPARAAPA